MKSGRKLTVNERKQIKRIDPNFDTESFLVEKINYTKGRIATLLLRHRETKETAKFSIKQ